MFTERLGVAGRAEVEASHGNPPGARRFSATATWARSNQPYGRPVYSSKVVITNTSSIMSSRYGFVDRPLVRWCNACDRNSVANKRFYTISSREDERLTKMPILMFLSGLHVHISHHTWLRIL
jgi:hypothetical protein